MRTRAVVLAVAIVMAPLGARGADLVMWWEQGYHHPEEEAAVREIVAAFPTRSCPRGTLDVGRIDQSRPRPRGNVSSKVFTQGQMAIDSYKHASTVMADSIVGIPF